MELDQQNSAEQEEINGSIFYALLSEFLGCVAINLFGCASTIQLMPVLTVTVPSIAITFGLIYIICTVMFRNISGACFNPAITIGMMLIIKMKFFRGLFYIVAQLIGSCVGSLILYCVTPTDKDQQFFHRNYSLGVTVPAESITHVQAMLVELIPTFILMLTILITMETNSVAVQQLAPFAIGLVFIAGICAFAQFTGGSFNPARSFGAALLADYWTGHWVYWAGPILGAILAALLFKVTLENTLTGDEELEYEEEGVDEESQGPVVPKVDKAIQANMTVEPGDSTN